MKRKRVEKAGETEIASESSGGSKRPEKAAAVTETVTVKVKEKKSVLRLIKDIIAYVVIGLIALATIFILISKATNKVPFIFGNSIAWVMTDSMEPMIPEQSYIQIREIKAKDVKVGDVIMFVSDDPALKGGNNTHRVVEIIGDNEEFVTKGERAGQNDSYTVKADKVRAVYVRNLPLLTRIGRIMRSGIGVMVAVTVVLVLTMILYLPDLQKLRKKKTEELEMLRQKQIDDLVKKEVERLKAEDANKSRVQKEESPRDEEETNV